MSIFNDNDLDTVMRISLQSALGKVEPPVDVWMKIEDELCEELAKPQVRFSLNGLLHTLAFISSRTADFLFSTPGWHDRLNEQRAQLLIQISSYPGANILSPGVV